MDKDIKQMWINALESGEYQQTQGNLRTGDAFCCLGVLCDLYAKNHDDAYWEDINYAEQVHKRPVKGFTISDEKEVTRLPLNIINWAGLPIKGAAYGGRGSRGNLASDNDNGKSFKEIANIIRENF